MSRLKILRKVEGLMIDGRNIEILDVLWHSIGHIFAFASSDHCANVMS